MVQPLLRPSVVIATHDESRWDQLVQAVASARGQSPRPMELIVAVDHNERLVQRVADELPDVLAVPNRFSHGASGTRNSGAECASGEVLVFLDDDTEAREGWLEHLLTPFQRDAGVVGVGGGVEPLWHAGRPRWFPDEFGWVVGISYRGLPTSTAPVRNVWSENMAVRRHLFEAVGGFRLDFGKVGRNSRPEDTDLCIRVAGAVPGGLWVYEPDAVVRHNVPADRSSFRFFLRRSYLEGKGKVQMAELLGSRGRLDAESRYLSGVVLPGLLGRLGGRDESGSRLGSLAQAGAMTGGLTAAGAGAVVATAALRTASARSGSAAGDAAVTLRRLTEPRREGPD